MVDAIQSNGDVELKTTVKVRVLFRLQKKIIMLKFLNYLFDIVVTFFFIKLCLYFGNLWQGIPLIFVTVIWYTIIGENYFNRVKIFCLKRYRRFISKKNSKKNNNGNL